MRWKTLTPRCSKCIQKTMCQISSQLPEFCRRYYRKHFGLFFSGHGVYTTPIRCRSLTSVGIFTEHIHDLHIMCWHHCTRIYHALLAEKFNRLTFCFLRLHVIIHPFISLLFLSILQIQLNGQKERYVSEVHAAPIESGASLP